MANGSCEPARVSGVPKVQLGEASPSILTGSTSTSIIHLPSIHIENALVRRSVASGAMFRLDVATAAHGMAPSSTPPEIAKQGPSDAVAARDHTPRTAASRQPRRGRPRSSPRPHRRHP